MKRLLVALVLAALVGLFLLKKALKESSDIRLRAELRAREEIAKKAFFGRKELGRKKTDVSPVVSRSGERGFWQLFDKGAVISWSRGTFLIVGEIFKEWMEKGGPEVIGFPLEEEREILPKSVPSDA